MRFIVLGAGAVGGVVGGRFAAFGHDVILIGRGAQYAAIRAGGLRIESPGSTVDVDIPIEPSPANIRWTADDVILLAVKTQDAAAALHDLASVAPADAPVVCVQNAVENERLAARRFDRVYGVCVMCPSAYLTPGVVQAWSSPTTGIMDVGRYPSGVDPVTETIASAFRSASFESEPRTDIMRWKYGKLLMSLGNAVEAICGPREGYRALQEAVRLEGETVLKAAGIPFTPKEEEMARRGNFLQTGAVGDRSRQGGSSWQSLQRRTANIEADYFNGEIALLGRLHGIPTPVNAALQGVANQFARERRAPGSMSVDALAALLSL